MTHDEKKRRARKFLDGGYAMMSERDSVAYELAKDYLALSAQLDAKEHAELIADAEIERAKALDEHNAELSARLGEALSFIEKMAVGFKP